MKKKETSWKEIGELLLKIIVNILASGIAIWASVNLFLSSFNIVFRLTFSQAVSIFIIALMLSNVFGIGGNSK